MNIFNNMERGVQTFSTGIPQLKKIDMMSDTAVANAALRKKANAEKDDANKAKLAAMSKDIDKQEGYKKVIMKNIHDAQGVNKVNTLSDIAKVAFFKDMLFEVFNGALLMDPDFIAENASAIRSLTDSYIDENGGFKLLEKMAESTNSILLQRMKSACESIALEVCKRKMSECGTDSNVDAIQFDVNEDEKNALDASKGELDLERISGLVKDKVLTVLQDEKAREEKDAELMTSIEDDLKDNDEVTDEKTLNEALQKMILMKPAYESATLFNALFRDAYTEQLISMGKSPMTENVAIASADKDRIDHARERSQEYDPDETIDEYDDKHDEPVEQTEIDHDMVLQDSAIDMDLVLVEAITKYTLMETLYTLKLEDYKHENIRKLTNKLVNPVIEASAKKDDSGNNCYVKIRGEFFKYFNPIKNETDVDKNKEALIKAAQKCADDGCAECKDAFKSCIGLGKGQLDNVAEKNAHMKKMCDEIKEWLDKDLTEALG